MKFILCFVLFFLAFNLYASDIYGKGQDGKHIFVEGYINDEPRLFVSKDGKYKSYTFKVTAAADHKHGDEFISVAVVTQKNGVKVRDFSNRKGDKVRFEGKYSEFKGNNTSGIVGSLQVD